MYLLGVTVSQYELAKFGREGLTAANANLTPLVVCGSVLPDYHCSAGPALRIL